MEFKYVMESSIVYYFPKINSIKSKIVVTKIGYWKERKKSEVDSFVNMKRENYYWEIIHKLISFLSSSRFPVFVVQATIRAMCPASSHTHSQDFFLSPKKNNTTFNSNKLGYKTAGSCWTCWVYQLDSTNMILIGSTTLGIGSSISYKCHFSNSLRRGFYSKAHSKHLCVNGGEDGKKKRVVVVGSGWAGLAAANHLCNQVLFEEKLQRNIGKGEEE